MTSAPPSVSTDYWRKFFRSANADIFEVIDQAIHVAASDYPEEFKNRRDQIVEKFFTVLLPRCLGCDPPGAEPEREEGKGSVKLDGEKESKVGSSHHSGIESELNHFVSNYSYDEAEAITEEVEEESQVMNEVLRIKEILANCHEESDNLLFESLRRLQLMELSVEVLTATEIGKAVNGLRKHNSKQIRYLTRTLIVGWKVLVDEWVKASAAIADMGPSPDSVNPSSGGEEQQQEEEEEEEGLPFPPLDEGAFFASQIGTMQLSEFFDGMDDDENFRDTREFDKKREIGKPPVNHEPVRKQQLSNLPVPENRDTRRQEPRQLAVPEERAQMKKLEPRLPNVPEGKGQMKRHDPVIKPPNKPQNLTVGQVRDQGFVNKQSKPIAASGPGRPSNLAMGLQCGNETKAKNSQSVTVVQRKPPTSLVDKSKNSEDAIVEARLEAAKRKLHEGYQQAENAKKQRTIQVMELHDIPKQAQQNRHPFVKPKNSLRNLFNGRR